ncbi:MAG: enoyl-CoA hydratase-related protein, partial [Halieaceae bacterium]|nr:enoyl-CoA hydratase-related protein [Halieaceae bacterium]
GSETFGDPGEDMSSCPLSMQAWDVRKPVIAACNGHAIGVGLSIAMQADLRVFAEDAKYGFLQNRRGVVADFAMESVLPRIVGFERAFELLVRAPRLTGTEAGEWGLASRVVPAELVLETAMEIAGDMAQHCAPLVMGLHKRLLWRGLSMELQDMVELETRALRHSMQQRDAAEGGLAWFEKRLPRWTGSVSRDWPEGWDD